MPLTKVFAKCFDIYAVYIYIYIYILGWPVKPFEQCLYIGPPIKAIRENVEYPGGRDIHIYIYIYTYMCVYIYIYIHFFLRF